MVAAHTAALRAAVGGLAAAEVQIPVDRTWESYAAAKAITDLIKLGGVIMSRVPVFGPRLNIAPTRIELVICCEREPRR